MDVATLSLISGSVLSLLFAYIPGVKDWYDALASQQKQGIMALALLVVSAAIFGLTCLGWLNSIAPNLVVTCDQQGAFGLVKVFILALIGNQATYSITPVKFRGK